jgi:hypothetical protein
MHQLQERHPWTVDLPDALTFLPVVDGRLR